MRHNGHLRKPLSFSRASALNRHEFVEVLEACREYGKVSDLKLLFICYIRSNYA
jgi:hypothetical protein